MMNFEFRSNPKIAELKYAVEGALRTGLLWAYAHARRAVIWLRSRVWRG